MMLQGEIKMPGRNLGIIIPVFNEAANVAAMVADLDQALTGWDWEVVFVDDNSPDGTAEVVRRLALADPRVRLVLRVADRGLSRSVVQGLLSAKADLLVVMDGDGQHGARAILSLVQALDDLSVDIVSGARRLSPDGAGQVLGGTRTRMSQAGNALCRMILRRPVTDPLTGFFALRRAAFLQVAPRLGDPGFKILLDILTVGRSLRHVEVPFDFADRRAGESKLNFFVIWQFATFLMSRLVGGLLPPAFISFALVGASGVAVHMTVLFSLTGGGVVFGLAHLAAALVAASWNFALNNVLTFADRQLRGVRLVWGYLKYLAVASIGIAGSFLAANFAFDRVTHVVALASLAGILVDVTWKYILSSRLVWR